MSATRLGPFELCERIGVGGMGEVWRATHLNGGDFAVKTLAETHRTAEWRARFQREVQAVAALDHPAIVAVVDAGTVGNTSWMAMELIGGGTLADRPPADWPSIQQLLVRLLGALARAHARGIVHRDLKPSNVLLAEADDAQSGWKLADFGIAHQRDQGGEDAFHGSPAFMAPEQLRGRWRDFGPWTDLYALGCIAWQLLTGEPPFTGSVDEVAYGHLQMPAGKLPGGTVAPPGIDAWLTRCLAKKPAERFQRAQDAAHMLIGLGGAQPRTGLPAAVPVPPPSRRVSAPGTGLGLYALRTRSIVGRAREQRLLWTAARDCSQSGSTQVVLLRGPSGAGKSALARWLSEELHVLGGASWTAKHEPDAARDGLAEMLVSAVAGSGLDRVQLGEHLADWGRTRGAAPRSLGALLERVWPAGPEDRATAVPRVGLAAPGARARAVSESVALVSGNRPTVVWIDDLQWGDAALDWVLGQVGQPGPLVVATVQEEGLAESRQRASIEELSNREDVLTITVGALVPDEWPTLVQGLLGLSGNLALQVEERTRGNAFFATQLVGDWVSRGLLLQGGSGFELRPGASVELPADLAEIWTQRLDRLLDGVSDSGRDALFVAALLGEVVHHHEWRAVCSVVGVDPEDAPVDRAARASLLQPGPEGWSFVHGMFREALAGRCERGRRQQLHQACADALLARDVEHTLAERVARHLLQTEDRGRALRPLWRASFSRQRVMDRRGATALLDERDALMEELQLPASDHAWPEGWIQRSRVMASSGNGSGSLDIQMRAVAHAREHGWTMWIARGALLAGGNLALSGRVEDGRELLHEISPWLVGPADRSTLADSLAICDIYERKYDSALAILEDGLRAFQGHHQHIGLWMRILAVHSYRMDLPAAKHAYDQVVRLSKLTGHSLTLGTAEENLGIQYHVAGDYEQALAHYRRGLEIIDELQGRSPNMEINVCLALAHLGRFAECLPALDAVEAVMPVSDRSRHCFITVIRVRIEASGTDRVAFGASLDRFEGLLEACQGVDTDFQIFAEQSAAVARGRGWIAEAERLETIDAAQRAAMS